MFKIFDLEFRRKLGENYEFNQRFNKTSGRVQRARVQRVFSSSYPLRSSLLSAEGHRCSPFERLRPRHVHPEFSGYRWRFHVGSQSVARVETGFAPRLGNPLQSMDSRRPRCIRWYRQRELLGRFYGNASTFRGIASQILKLKILE